MHLTKRLAVSVLSTLAGVSPASAVVRYVKPAGAGDCLTWATACALQTAIDAAAADPDTDDQVWVQAGTYGAIALPNGVKVIGGFGGGESSASQSNPSLNVTTLDGGGAGPVVTSSNSGPSTVLRGVRVRNGALTGFDQDGAGIFLEESSAKIVQCTIEDNRAQFFGAGVSIRGSGTPQFVNCIFRNNGLGTEDAAQDQNAQPYGGGAVYLYSGAPSFVNCLFHHNKAGEGGAVLVFSGQPTFINCTFTLNRAKLASGGAIFDLEAQAIFKNCILWGNTAVREGAQIHSLGSLTSVEYSDVQGGWPGTGNINADPLFVHPVHDDFRIPVGSPCKDYGNNLALPSDAADLDWDGNVSEKIPWDLVPAMRKVQGTVDMGAYEGPADIE